MTKKINISRDDIAESIHKEFGFSRKECLDFVNEIIETIILGLERSNKVKIHNFGTFKLKRKSSRIGRNPKTKEDVMIQDRNVISFKPSRRILKFINDNKNNEEIS